MDKYFMHRIKEENGTFTAGIEVHDTEDSAIRSFHSYMKQGFGNPNFPNITFVACFVEKPNCEIDPRYNEMWGTSDAENKIFFHHTRKNGDVFSKAIDVYDTMEEAEASFHAEMEYGYSNDKFPDVSFESCKITERLSKIILKEEAWVKPEEQPVTPEEPEVPEENPAE